jgi:hypothetical protein
MSVDGAMRYSTLPHFLSAFVALALAVTSPAQDVPLPPRPESHVFDNAKVFTPEQIARLAAALQKAAREDGIEVYVVTMPAVPKGQLAQLGDAITREWTQNAVGGTLVFEDQFGNVTVGTSEETDRRFTTLVINMVMREPLMVGRKKGISPDKLERAAYSVVASLKSLVDKERREQRGKWIANGLMALVALFAGTIIGLSSWSRRKRELAAMDSKEEAKVPDNAA